MGRVSVNIEILQWALERSNRSPDELEKRFPQIKRWLSGELKPTLNQLKSFAKATYTPFGFFFLRQPPEEKLPFTHFRTYKELPRKPSLELLDTVKIIKRRQEWIKEFLIEEGYSPLPYVNSVKLGDTAEFVAQKIRETLGFEKNWASKLSSWKDALQFLRNEMQKIGIFVVFNSVVENNPHRKLNPEEFRGFVLVDDYAPFVFVNSSDALAAQMFTLAHELAHIFYGVSASFDLRELFPADDPIEIICNKVAAEFLVPKEELLNLWSFVFTTKEPFQEIARKFKVSEIVIARRALDLKLIKKSEFLEFYKEYLRKERKKIKKVGGDFYKNQDLRVGEKFATAVAIAVEEGKLLYSEAFRLTGLYGRTFDKYISYLKRRGLIV